MKIKYEFVTEVIEIEVDDKYGHVIEEMNRKEKSADRHKRRHELRLDTQNDRGNWVAEEDSDEVIEKLENARKAFAALSPKQRALVDALFGENKITAKEYAQKEGVSCAAITERKNVIKKKLKKF